ncbi:hypothetical protein DCCM_1994 [Desulfocucumis palustris]|uniref:N-acetyltransferase domain-containing protein n=1 Tax=Desulfocucumis palustris TaxID=1898651 RepID=A0A2L2X9G4_9FIRM|nr:GNAT family N-acetyltransferase [Desulfocucumis palustris]GBF32897.1 hypothetical protein DCCM_1994 [Desulfocucumis palustris]
MDKNLETFDSKLGDMFPGCKDIIAEIKDFEVIKSFLYKLIDGDTGLNLTFSTGEISRKPHQLLQDNGHLMVLDREAKVVHRFRPPLKMLVTRFPEHPRHSFVRIGYTGAEPCDARKVKLPAGGQGGELIISVKNKTADGGFVLYPLGSLLYDPRIQKQVWDLAGSGRESQLFAEIVVVEDEGSDNSKKGVKLVPYTSEDASLWEKWQKNIDTSIFETTIGPRNFTAGKRQGEEYHLYMIEYAGKKVGAAWVEQILPRISSAELGILIGEPQFWGLGIGTQAMQAMMEIAKSKLGLKFLWISVREANTRALTCYKKCGFVIKKKMPVINKSDGSYQIWVTMERML